MQRKGEEEREGKGETCHINPSLLSAPMYTYFSPVHPIKIIDFFQL